MVCSTCSNCSGFAGENTATKAYPPVHFLISKVSNSLRVLVPASRGLTYLLLDRSQQFGQSIHQYGVQGGGNQIVDQKDKAGKMRGKGVGLDSYAWVGATRLHVVGVQVIILMVALLYSTAIISLKYVFWGFFAFNGERQEMGGREGGMTCRKGNHAQCGNQTGTPAAHGAAALPTELNAVKISTFHCL